MRCSSVGDEAMTRKDLGRGGLLLQGVRQLTVALLQLIEEPGALHRDSGLVGERLQQGNLAGAEWANLHAHGGNRAHHLLIANERCDHARPVAELRLQLPAKRKLLLGDACIIVELDRLTVQDRSAGCPGPRERARHVGADVPNGPDADRSPRAVTRDEIHEDASSVTQSRGALGDGLQHDLEIGCR